MLLGQVALTGTFQAQLCYVDFSAAELETYQLGPPASAAAAPYFLSSHMLFLTSQRTKLSNV